MLRCANAGGIINLFLRRKFIALASVSALPYKCLNESRVEVVYTLSSTARNLFLGLHKPLVFVQYGPFAEKVRLHKLYLPMRK
jgi:hypothetical protein